MPLKSRGIRSGVISGKPAVTGCPFSFSALFSAVRVSRPIGLSPASGSSVRSRMMTFFLPASASTTARSGKGRKTFRWIDPTLAPRVCRRWSTAASQFSAAEPSERNTVSASSALYCVTSP